MIEFNNKISVYIQIADWIEGEILDKNINVGERVPSQNELARMLNINPTTSANALSLLLQRDVVEKRRGLGMFVTEKSYETIKARRSENIFDIGVRNIVMEAKHLNVSKEELIKIIIKEWDDRNE